MRRLTALGFLLALVAGLLPMAQIGVAHAQQSLSIQIAPAIEGNTAVRSGQQVTVSGQVPAGTITRADLVAVRSRDEARQDMNHTIGRPAGEGDYLRNDNGQLSGRLTLGCLFGELDGPPCPGRNDVAERVLLELTVAGVNGRSNSLNVDVLPPHILRYELRQTNRIRVVFNEPVRHPEGDSPLDWCMRGDAESCNLPPDGLPGGSLRVVTAVEGPTPNDCLEAEGADPTNGATGCTRTLVFTPAAGEDANPHTRYDLSRTRQPYEDYASNEATRTLGAAFSDALDRIRPALPNIESVDGKVPSGGQAHSNNTAPTVRVSNVTAGHDVFLRVTGPGTDTQTNTVQVAQNANTVDVPVPTLPRDGGYTLAAVAVDPSGNRSDETDKHAGRADGSRPAVQYILDTVAPRVVQARLVNNRTVEVLFNEPVEPAGNAGEWRVGDQPVTAEGSGEQRRLVSSVDLTNPVGQVRWTPTSDQPGSTGRYGDRAGNGMAALSGLPLGDLPILGPPAVTVPPGEIYTNAGSQRIAGTAPKQDNLVVQLFDRGAEQPRNSTQVSDGRWSFDEPLNADRRYEFEVRLRDTQSGIASPRVAVPDIVRDTAAPDVEVLAPGPAPFSLEDPLERRQRYGVGGNVEIRWRASDPAPNDAERSDHGDRVDIIAVFGDGGRRAIAEGIEYQAGQEQTYSYTFTQADLAGRGTREITFEVVVWDLAENQGTDTSSPILLVANLIDYTAALVEPRTIEARFPVVLSGNTLPAEWYINDQPAQMAEKTTRESGTVIRLTWAQNSDPNATPKVRYQPVLVNPTPLQAPNGTPISTAEHVARDEIVPALAVDTSGSGRHTNQPVAQLTGTTDTTSSPNTVFAYRADGAGNPQGDALASTVAGSNGQWSLEVPLERNTTNRIVFRAVDPSGNRSPVRPGTPYVVVQDSIAPEAVLARLVGRRTVDVLFSEPIVPAGHAGRWFVRSNGRDVPVTAEGSDAQRRLVANVDLDNPEYVRWEPTSDEPGTAGRYGDRAGNGLSTIAGIPLADLVPIAPPAVTVPAGELYTSAGRTTISGTAPTQANLVAELFDRESDQPRSSTPVNNGRWSFDQELPSDGRYLFDVRLRHTQTGSTSPRVAVPDIVRDTVAPQVDVTQPNQAPLTPNNATDRRRRYGVGDNVTVRWTASDPAANDSKRPDHGDSVDIAIVYGDGAPSRTVARGIGYQPGQEQSYNYTLTEADLAGAASREIRFEVTVTDLARNKGVDTSDAILLLASLVGYTPVLVSPDTIEVRFVVPVQGQTTPGEWFVDESQNPTTPAQAVSRSQDRDGNTVIRLTVAHINDPNATPWVRYQPLLVNPTPLRGSGGREVSTNPRQVVDGIAPTLTVREPNTGSRPIDAASVSFSGTTDRTRYPNTVSAFRTDATGAVQGPAIARVVAGSDGSWQMDVPLERNATNRIVIRAADPANNLSNQLPNPPYTVVEDSLAPVVRITSPKSGALVAPVLDIKWETVEANKESVRIDYRVGSEQWRPIADRINDTGTYRWEIPNSLHTVTFSLRVTAMDQTAKTGAATVDGLRLDLEQPAILKARATGAQVLDITFTEPVTLNGDGFTVGGAKVRRVDGDGARQTLILSRPMDSTTPMVEYSGTNVVDEAGNELDAVSVRAKRSFAFAVTELEGRRVTKNRVRVTWADSRNRTADLRGYRIYRDGTPIALVGSSTRAYTDAEASGRHIYTVRAVDDRRRVSSVRRITVR